MKLTKKLTPKQFILSNLFILVICLILLASLYYILNIQYQGSKNPFSNGPVSTPPKSFRLTLDQPDDEILVYTSSIPISGQTGPNMEVLISTDTSDLVIHSKPDGSFSTDLDLDEGVNRITIAAFDPTGDFRSAQRTVYYSKEKI